jgi:phosphoribosylaminoimidazole-succinocarboxamide synthase
VKTPSHRGRGREDVTERPLKPPSVKGKVRDIYDLGDRLLLVASDRISAFDSVLPDEIPAKGEVLNKLSGFWFGHLADICENHFFTTDLAGLPADLVPYTDYLTGRSMIVRKADVFPVECIVRGYLAGSGWAEYRTMGSVCGHELPEGLREADKLDEPLFTPSTKATIGHDVNISIEEMYELIGEEMGVVLESKAVDLYTAAAEHAASRGIIIADTKFEFGLIEGHVVLVDEALTPDSSRFWPADDYEPGRTQTSFDKQYVRDHLTESGWDKHPPAPRLPEEVVARTSEKYVQAYEMLTGETFVREGA